MARRPRGIFKRKDSKFWWMCWAVTSGTKKKYKQASTKTTSLKDAKQMLDTRQREATGSPLGAAAKGSLTLSQLGKIYETSLYGKPAAKPVERIFKLLCARLGDVALEDLTPLQLHEYMIDRQRTDKVKPATVRHEMRTLKTALRKALNLALISDSLACTLLRVEIPKPSKGRLRYLTLEEAVRLLKCCPLWLQKLVITAIYTGFRMGEIRSLSWKRFDRDAGYVYLHKTKNGEPRHVPLMDTVLNLFRSQSQLERQSPYIFSNSQGQPLTNSWITHAFLDAAHRASIEDFRFHDTRHTFGSWASMAGADFYAISKLLGHANTKSTEIYIQLSPNHLTRQVLSLDGHPETVRKHKTKTDNFFKLLHDYFTVGPGKGDLHPQLFSSSSPTATDVSSDSTDRNSDNSDMAA